MIRHTARLMLACALLAPTVASAQTLGQNFPGLGALGSNGGAVTGSGLSGGGLSGLASGLLPNVGASSAGNAAGVLGYCVKNNVLQGGGAAAVLGQLTGRQDVTQSKGFALGQQGTLKAGQQSLSLGDIKGKLKTKVCSMVLDHAKSFL